ncbi:MAG: hypothetical protein HOQ32_07535 [Lysobacter sp.]|nr:hypothetical protein [Lysobacter sp.]
MSSLMMRRLFFVAVQVGVFSLLGFARPRELSAPAFYVFNAVLAVLASIWLVKNHSKKWGGRLVVGILLSYFISVAFFGVVFLSAYTASRGHAKVGAIDLVSSNILDFIKLMMLSALIMFNWLAVAVAGFFANIFSAGKKQVDAES